MITEARVAKSTVHKDMRIRSICILCPCFDVISVGRQVFFIHEFTIHSFIVLVLCYFSIKLHFKSIVGKTKKTIMFVNVKNE